jgi:MFS family permease
MWAAHGATLPTRVLRASPALFYVAILDEFAWGRGPTALGYSLSWLCFVVFAPVAGWLYDRWGARTVVPMGGLVLGVALVLTGQVMSLTQYYLCFGVLSAAGTACIVIPSTAIVTRWFVRSRGTAMGVLTRPVPLPLSCECLAYRYARLADGAHGLRLDRRGGDCVACPTLPRSPD